jgi:hypothetical protein
MTVSLQDGSPLPSGACLKPVLAQNMKIFLTSENKHYNISQ